MKIETLLNIEEKALFYMESQINDGQFISVKSMLEQTVKKLQSIKGRLSDESETSKYVEIMSKITQLNDLMKNIREERIAKR